MRVIECEQGSAQWLDARCGKITASRICDLMKVLTKASKNGKAGDAAAPRLAYSIDLIAERLSGRSEDHYVSPEMEWGSHFEDQARTAYELERSVMAEKVGFILHPTLDFAGASPDSLIGNDGGIEIKCPKTTTHIKWILAGEVPEEHQEQCLWNMACAESTWWDFVSYDPRLPDGLKLFIVRMNRDSERIAEIEAEVIRFNAAVEDMVTELRKRIVERPIDTRSEYDQLMATMDRMELIP